MKSAQAGACSCLNKSKCPLNDQCLSSNVLHRANIASTAEDYGIKTYYSISETRFKLRYVNRQKSFKNRKCKTDTEFSNEIRKLKKQNKNVDISWEFLGIQPYNIAAAK